MKLRHRLLIPSILLFLFIFTSPAESQLVIGTGSEPSIQLGYDFGRLVFSIGTDFVYNTIAWENYQTKIENSILVTTPSIVLQLFFIRRDLSPYLKFRAGKGIPLAVSAKEDGSTDEREEERLKKQNDDFTFKLSAGLEYFITKSVSAGGECGVKVLPAGVKMSDYELSAFTVQTFSTLTFHYYFGKK